MLAHYIHRRLLPSFNKNGILTCDSEIIEGSWRCQLVFRFLQNIEKGGKHAQKPSIFIVLLAFAMINFFLLAILHCNWLKIMVIVSDLDLHSLASMLDRNKNRKKPCILKRCETITSRQQAVKKLKQTFCERLICTVLFPVFLKLYE